MNSTVVLLFVGCLTSPQHASVSQGRICSDNFTCCHTEVEVADPTFHLTQSQYSDTVPTIPSVDLITSGAWQGNYWSANFLSNWYDSAQAGFEPWTFRSRGGRLTTRPTSGALSAVLEAEIGGICYLDILIKRLQHTLPIIFFYRPPAAAAKKKKKKKITTKYQFASPQNVDCISTKTDSITFVA